MASDANGTEPDVEIVCPRCGYRMRRSAERLRRDTEIVCPNCGAVIVPPGGADEAPQE